MIPYLKRRSKSSKAKLEERYNKVLNDVLEFTSQQGIRLDKRLESRLEEAQKLTHQLSQF